MLKFGFFLCNGKLNGISIRIKSSLYKFLEGKVVVIGGGQ